jgi:hypothetical protein
VTAKRKRRGSAPHTIGGIIVGFDQQIFRTLPPVQELIVKGQPVRGVSGEDGTDFLLVFPGDAREPESEPERPAEPDS